jgi:hypothetical protein
LVGRRSVYILHVFFLLNRSSGFIDVDPLEPKAVDPVASLRQEEEESGYEDDETQNCDDISGSQPVTPIPSAHAHEGVDHMQQEDLTMNIDPRDDPGLRKEDRPPSHSSYHST